MYLEVFIVMVNKLYLYIHTHVNKHINKQMFYVYIQIYIYTHIYLLDVCYCTGVTKRHKTHFSSQRSCSLEEGDPCQLIKAMTDVSAATVWHLGGSCSPTSGGKAGVGRLHRMMLELMSSVLIVFRTLLL